MSSSASSRNRRQIHKVKTVSVVARRNTRANKGTEQPQALAPQLVQKVKGDVSSVSPGDLIRLQRTLGNKEVVRRMLLQRKMSKSSIQSRKDSGPGDQPQKVASHKSGLAKANGELEQSIFRPVYKRDPANGAIYRSKQMAGTNPGQHIRTSTLTTIDGVPFIQRFDGAKDVPHLPTTDWQHPALANAGMGKPIGPYKFDPMAGTFTYQEPNPAEGMEKFLRRLKFHKTPGAVFGPEKIAPVAGKFSWFSKLQNKNVDFHPAGLIKADPADRIAAATKKWNTYKHKYDKYNTLVAGKVLDELRVLNKGNSPRPFAGIAAEDAKLAANHNVDRHTVGGAEMPDTDAVAARAAMKLLGGLQAGAVKGVATQTASAFQDKAAADLDVGAAIAGEFTKNWDKYRLQLLTKGTVNLKVPRAGSPIVAYKRIKAGAPWPIAEKPAYLVPGAKGHKPLFYPDIRWDAWAKGKLTVKEINTFKAQPLTEDVSGALPNINVRIIASDQPGHGGWTINSAYPVGK